MSTDLGLKKLGFFLCSCFLWMDTGIAAESEYLYRNEIFCSKTKDLCVKGSFSYHRGTLALKLNGRVKSASGPGLLRIRVKGVDKYGRKRVTDFELAIRGKTGEILNGEVLIGTPEVKNWEVDGVFFAPGVNKNARKKT